MNPLNHVAIIMDGNGRWGLKHKNSKNAGHKAGITVKVIKETIRNKLGFNFIRLFNRKLKELKRNKFFI